MSDLKKYANPKRKRMNWDIIKRIYIYMLNGKGLSGFDDYEPTTNITYYWTGEVKTFIDAIRTDGNRCLTIGNRK